MFGVKKTGNEIEKGLCFCASYAMNGDVITEFWIDFYAGLDDGQNKATLRENKSYLEVNNRKIRCKKCDKQIDIEWRLC